jgi:hypothetical protein
MGCSPDLGIAKVLFLVDFWLRHQEPLDWSGDAIILTVSRGRMLCRSLPDFATVALFYPHRSQSSRHVSDGFSIFLSTMQSIACHSHQPK